MEVASGEYDIDLSKAANIMLQYKPESTSSAWEDVPVISSFSNTLSELYILQYIMLSSFSIDWIKWSLLVVRMINMNLEKMYK